MIVAVAVCPGAPLLVPGLAQGLASITPDPVDRCAAAVATLRGGARILLLTSGPRARDLHTGGTSSLGDPPGTVVNTAPLTDSRLAPGYSSVLAGAAPGARSPRKGLTPPGGGHGGAASFDALLAGALATGDPISSAAAVSVGRRVATDMLWTSGPPLGAVAALDAAQPPTCVELLYDDAPFGVGYLVATWTWE